MSSAGSLLYGPARRHGSIKPEVDPLFSELLTLEGDQAIRTRCQELAAALEPEGARAFCATLLARGRTEVALWLCAARVAQAAPALGMPSVSSTATELINRLGKYVSPPEDLLYGGSAGDDWNWLVHRFFGSEGLVLCQQCAAAEPGLPELCAELGREELAAGRELDELTLAVKFLGPLEQRRQDLRREQQALLAAHLDLAPRWREKKLKAAWDYARASTCRSLVNSFSKEQNTRERRRELKRWLARTTLSPEAKQTFITGFGLAANPHVTNHYGLGLEQALRDALWRDWATRKNQPRKTTS